MMTVSKAVFRHSSWMMTAVNEDITTGMLIDRRTALKKRLLNDESLSWAHSVRVPQGLAGTLLLMGADQMCMARTVVRVYS